MAKTVLIEKLIVRKNQIGVKYLIEDTVSSVVKRVDVKIGGDENPSVYGNQNADSLYALPKAEVVDDGERIFESLWEEEIRELHLKAIATIKRGIKAGDELGDILDAIMAVYTDAGATRVTDLLVDLYQTWNAGTNGEKNQFIIFMVFVLTVLSK